MTHISDDEEAKALGGIKILVEGEMKEKMMDTFLRTMLKKKGSTYSPTRKGIFPKSLFVDGIYENNTKLFQRNHQQDKKIILTINEVNQDIKNLKKEISEIKAQFSRLERGNMKEEKRKDKEIPYSLLFSHRVLVHCI